MIYRIKDDNRNYLIAGIGAEALLSVYDSYRAVKQLLAQANTNESLKSVWKPFSFPMRDATNSDKGLPLPDVVLWPCGLVLSHRAYDCLAQHLEPFGEFHEATADGQPVALFSCLTFGQEDMTQTIIDYHNGKAIGLEHLVFDDADVENKLVFKSKRQYGSVLYCGEKFKALCEQHDLKGLRFDADLMNVF